MTKIKKDPIFESLKLIAEHIPANFYCMDLTGRFAALNQRLLSGIGAKSKESVIGKNVHEFYKNKEIADELQKDITNVLKTGIPSLVEDKIIDVTTGKIRYFSATRAPLRNKNGEIVGIIGTSIETTAEKEAELHKLENERLKLENEIHQAQAKERQERQLFVDDLIRTLQASVTSFLNKDIGIKEHFIQNPEIKLTSREAQVLYALYHKKNAKSTANYLTKKLNKPFTSDSVNTVVSKFLYPKFEVNSIDELINKAILLKMIPLLFPEKISKKGKELN